MKTETIGTQANTAVSYSYDKDGLVTAAGALALGRDGPSGRVTTKTVGNIRETFTYSSYGELASQKVERLSGGSVVEKLYEAIYEDGGANGARDGMGRIVKKTERCVIGSSPVSGDTPTSGARPLETHVYEYGYNPLGRPWLENVAVDGVILNTYRYDSNGNRVAAELHPSLLGADPANDVTVEEADTEYDAGDRLLRYGTKSYAWNDFGQLSSMTDSATNETTTYHYDLFGNLLRVDLPDGRAVEYDVDGAGRRVGRHVRDEAGAELEYRGWIYRDLLRPIAEVDALGNVVARYVYADGTGAEQNGVKQLLIRLGANPDTSLPFSGRNVPEYVIRYQNGVANDVLRLITNHLGTVQLVTNVTTGEVVQRMDYDEFGRVFFDSNPGVQPFGFAGGLQDSLTGLVRFGARDYSPEVGRWTARDPVRFDGEQVNMLAFMDKRSSPVFGSSRFASADADADAVAMGDDWRGRRGWCGSWWGCRCVGWCVGRLPLSDRGFRL